jgi:hypothetical protein
MVANTPTAPALDRFLFDNVQRWVNPGQSKVGTGSNQNAPPNPWTQPQLPGFDKGSIDAPVAPPAITASEPGQGTQTATQQSPDTGKQIVDWLKDALGLNGGQQAGQPNQAAQFNPGAIDTGPQGGNNLTKPGADGGIAPGGGNVAPPPPPVTPVNSFAEFEARLDNWMRGRDPITGAEPGAGAGAGAGYGAGAAGGAAGSNPLGNAASGGQSAYGAGPGKLIMTEGERDARYYQGGIPNNKSFFGNSTNVKSDVVAKDVMNAVKDNWGSVDPKVRDMFENGGADKFFGPNKPPGFDKMQGWQKAALFELGKMSFETAGTFDPNHKDPGDQAWGGLSLYNKDPNFKNYGLSGDLRSPENRAAMTSPGYSVIADLNTTMDGANLQQANPFGFGANDLLDRSHFTFVGKDQGEYQRQKSDFNTNVFGSSNGSQRQNLGTQNLFEFVMQNS